MKIMKSSDGEYLVGEGVIVGPLSCGDQLEDGDIGDAEMEAMRLYLEEDLPPWKVWAVKSIEAFDKFDYSVWTRIVGFAFWIEATTGWDSQSVVDLANAWKACRQEISDWLALTVIR